MRITDRLQPLAAAGIIAASFIATVPPEPKIPPRRNELLLRNVPMTPDQQQLNLTHPSQEENRSYLESLSVPPTFKQQEDFKSQSPTINYPLPDERIFPKRTQEPGIAA